MNYTALAGVIFIVIVAGVALGVLLHDLHEDSRRPPDPPQLFERAPEVRAAAGDLTDQETARILAGPPATREQWDKFNAWTNSEAARLRVDGQL